jgi:hypothetical protein
MPKNAEKYVCEYCDYKCSKLSNYNIHLTTRKHLILTNTSIGLTQKNTNTKFSCDCGKIYNHRQSLYNHKKKCNFIQENTPKEENPPKEENTPKENERDKLINILFNEKKEMLEERKEMKELILLMVKSMQDVIPHVGNGTNNTTGDHNNVTNSNNTLNFYLTNTCKDAESITEFTARFCERIETFFNGNYQKISNNQTDLAKDVQEMFFECLEDKTQANKFIQTTDTKNGVYFVKEPNKVEKELTFGDSEFVKYKDSFKNPGSRIGHEINKVLQPCRTELENTLLTKPKEEDFEDEDKYDKAKEEYHKTAGVVKENLMFQTYYAANIFDKPKTTEKVMSNTKRPKSVIEK